VNTPCHSSREAIEAQVRRRVDAERTRLGARGTSEPPREHFRRPAERPFTAAERNRVTILTGGLTWKHEWLLRAVFESAGYRVEMLPTPDVAAFQLGKEYGNNGQCNPTYFMVGHLIQYLKGLEAYGLSPQEIIEQYVFFTAGSCGPCRFGMYEAEYRLAVEHAGYPGFRILLFQQDDGLQAASGQPGLAFTADFGLGAFNALTAGDVLNDVCNRIRPYEVVAGTTDGALREATALLATALRDRRMFEIAEQRPRWLVEWLMARPRRGRTANTIGKIGSHLWGRQTKDALQAAREHLARIEVDRLRMKPIVKITGEFFAQTTEGDGNFRMFAFLEREGAEVRGEPIANWILYLLWQAKARRADRKWLDMARPRAWQVHTRLVRELRFARTQALFAVGDTAYRRLYDRVSAGLGGLAHGLLDMDELAAIAQPYYHRFARGGEGHLEVAKNIYYTTHRKAHMVLSLKPFGCMPSSQSDGVQSAVMSHFPEMIFLPIETSGEGEINAHSRVQMALGEAKAKARVEFERAVDSTGRRLDDLRAYVAEHRSLRDPFLRVPAVEGVTGTGAHFVLHVGRLMDAPIRSRLMIGGRRTSMMAGR